MKVENRTLPPETDFKVLPVALPISSFLVLAATIMPINGLVLLRAAFRILFLAFSLT